MDNNNNNNNENNQVEQQHYQHHQHQTHDDNDDDEYDGRRITDEDLIKEIISAPKETVFQLANRMVEEKTADSLVLDPTVDSMIPKFDETEIRLGRVLGRGGFCIVQEIDKVKIPGMKKSSASDGGGSSIGSFLFSRQRSSMYEDDACSNNGSRYAYSDAGGGGLGGLGLGDSDRCNSRKEDDEDVTNNTGGGAGRRQQQHGSDRMPRMSRMSLARLSRKKKSGISVGGGGSSRRPFAFKQVNTELQYDNKMNYMKGIVDLAMEAKFLSNLDHPNIIGLCGISKFGPSQFIIIDKLSITLSQKISKDWMKIDRQCKGITGLFTGSKHKINELNSNRFMVAFEIASACQYLHERNIIFRDLKPDNIGFDSNGTVKLFDFGLAKELKKKDQVVLQSTKRKDNGNGNDNDDANNNGGLCVVYNLTGVTGAIRYMSPENALNKPYNLSSDVWSFSMILWFILALEPPFGFYTESMILDRVLKRGSRPAVFDSWPNHIKDLLKRSWKTNLIERPTFTEICIKLKHVLSTSNGGSNGGSGGVGIDHTTTTAAAAIAPVGTITESSANFSLADESSSGFMAGVGGVGSKSG